MDDNKINTKTIFPNDEKMKEKKVQMFVDGNSIFSESAAFYISGIGKEPPILGLINKTV